MRRQQQGKEKRDEIWDELSGSSEEDEEEEEVDFSREERQKENQTGLLDRMERQLGSLGLKRGKQEVAEVEGKGKAIRMKENTNKTFDDVLWQEKSKTSRSKRNEGASNMEEETYTKLIAFSEAVKKIALLVKNAKGGSDDELQTERLVARRLCREVEVELRQLQPLGTTTTKTSTRARARARSVRAEEEEEEDEDDGDQRRAPGRREREEGMQYKRLKAEFEKMKQRFEEIDNALRERERKHEKKTPRKSNTSRDPSTSLFGELNVRDDYDSPPPPTSSAQTQQRRDQGTARESSEAKRRPSAKPVAAATAVRSRTAKAPRTEDSGSDEETLESRAGGSGRVQLQKQQPKKVVDMDNSLQTLEGELEQLLNLFRDFNELVHAQQPMIDQFEEKVLAAEEQTKSAVTELATGASYSAYGLPLVGAAVGMLIGGPLGAIAGAKGMAAVGVCMMGGMGVGAYVGRQISAKQKQEATLILERYRHSQRHDGEQDGQELRSLRRDGDDDEDDERPFDESEDSDDEVDGR